MILDFLSPRQAQGGKKAFALFLFLPKKINNLKSLLRLNSK